MRKQLIRKLHAMQKWRRGGKGTMPLSPKEFGEAIDDCIRVLRMLEDEHVNEMLYVRKQTKENQTL